MPNMLGGSQSHPAYTGENLSKDPRRALVNGREYVIHGNGKKMYVTWEDVDGKSGICGNMYGIVPKTNEDCAYSCKQAPLAVRRKIVKLRKQETEKNKKERLQENRTITVNLITKEVIERKDSKKIPGPATYSAVRDAREILDNLLFIYDRAEERSHEIE